MAGSMGHRGMSLFGACRGFRMVSLTCLRELSEQLTLKLVLGEAENEGIATYFAALLSIEAVERKPAFASAWRL